MSTFEIRRSALVPAPPQRVQALVDDLRAWRAWSPWEGLDPDLEREYSGPAAGEGAAYAWRGNRRAGRGRMRVTGSEPGRTRLELQFEKPFKARNDLELTFEARPDGTEVTWVMTGERSGVSGVIGRVLQMDKLIGRDFERGLERLSATASA